MKADRLVIETYKEADAIYSLSRSKVLSAKERAFDWLVAFLTPAPGIVEEADLISDLGLYFLVISEEHALLVRVEKGTIEQKTLDMDVSHRSFNYKGNRFKKVMKIYGEAV